MATRREGILHSSERTAIDEKRTATKLRSRARHDGDRVRDVKAHVSESSGSSAVCVCWLRARVVTHVACEKHKMRNAVCWDERSYDRHAQGGRAVVEHAGGR